jgi:diguanylate cyclase (GGDEF)-like protein/PAS domain S-box-containing protein
MAGKEKFMENPSKENLSDRFIHLAACLEDFCPRRTALRISSVYVIIGILWILLSDKILDWLLSDQRLITMISMLKGWVYVLVTGTLLFLLILSSLNKILSINRTLLKNYEELAAVYEELSASEQELQKKMEMLAESEERYRLVSEATNDGIWDEKQGERHFSERWHEIMGYSRDELTDIKDWMSLIHPEDIDLVKQKLLWHKQNRDPNYRCEYRLKHKNGDYRWILSRARLIFDAHGEIVRSAGSHTDITDLKKYQERLKQLAFKDFLTALPNRISFYQTVRKQLADWPDRKMALMFIDADNFKYINDTIGYSSGDKIIADIGKRLMILMDSSKSVYRIGGDEFVVFIHQYESTEEIESFAEELVKCFKTPFQLSNCSLNITASIGIALYPLHGNDADTLLKCADMAMYKAKSTVRGRYVFYNQDMDQRVKERMMVENELRCALDRNEFELYYQPQLDINTGKICAFEALLRWKNDKLGLASPLKFISIAEETHLINPIGDWVLQSSCRFLKTLHNQGYSDIRISVNVSIIQLMKQDFTDKLMETLAQTGIHPEHLELEVTESVFIESYEAIKHKLADLISKGITIALDDFGKGYSSLSYLTQIPITTLKIDKSFIDTVGSGRIDRSLTSMIIMIGRRLGLTVVAEGVETEGQLEYLKKHKCHKAQGYYFSKPLPHEEVLVLLNKEHDKVPAGN